MSGRSGAVNALGRVTFFPRETSTEKFYLSWFTSNGSITNSQVYVDEKTILKFDQTLPEKAIVTVFLRDGRGGVAFNYVVLE